MKKNNILATSMIAWVIIIASFALYQSTNAPTLDTPSTYIGMSVEDATQLFEWNTSMFRVVNIDWEPQMTTKDYRVGRVNATTVDGVVTDFYIEGE